MTLDHDLLERGIGLFRDLIEADPELRRELQASEREYFRGSAPRDPEGPAQRSARRRHLEWFLCERRSPRGELAVESLLFAWRELAGPALGACSESFLQSEPGMFEVAGVERGTGAVLRDLAGLGEFAVLEPEASQVLEEGDLIVGRLFPLGDGRHAISSGAGFFRDPILRAALMRDLERLREGRRHAVLRLAQIELEAMFWGSTDRAADGEAGAHGHGAVEAARRFLAAGGLAADAIEGLLAELARSPFPAGALVPGAGDPLGEVLASLAFDTELDLDLARPVLWRAWRELATPDAPQEPAVGEAVEEAEVRRAVAEFERDRARGRDLEQAFAALERRLGLADLAPIGEVDEAEEEEGGAGTPDFPGVVAAVVEEFLWEVGTRDQEAARELACLRLLGRFGAPIGVFENLTARDLVTFTCFWLPESGELTSASGARKLLDALERFCVWVEETHALELWASFRPILEGLRESLPRIALANRRLRLPGPARDPEAEPEGELFELRHADERGRATFVSRTGEELRTTLDAALARILAPGDRARAARTADGDLRLLCAYPPEAALLLA